MVRFENNNFHTEKITQATLSASLKQKIQNNTQTNELLKVNIKNILQKEFGNHKTFSDKLIHEILTKI